MVQIYMQRLCYVHDIGFMCVIDLAYSDFMEVTFEIACDATIHDFLTVLVSLSIIVLSPWLGFVLLPRIAAMLSVEASLSTLIVFALPSIFLFVSLLNYIVFSGDVIFFLIVFVDVMEVKYLPWL